VKVPTLVILDRLLFSYCSFKYLQMYFVFNTFLSKVIWQPCLARNSIHRISKVSVDK